MNFSVNYFIIFEVLAFVSFTLIVARELHHRNYRRVFEIASCAVFGMILEIGNTYLAHTYSYSTSFLVNLAQVPVAIGLGWAVIIYCAMLLSDQYNIPWYLRPYMDALTAVVIDMTMDVVAIRLGFWSWVIPQNAEWYGVPFENLVGWILVVLSFSFLIRFIRTLNPKRFLTILIMITSPILSYAGLMAGLTVFSLIAILPYGINNWTTLLQFQYIADFSILYNPQVQFWKLILFTIIMTELVHIVAWSLIRYRRKYLRHFDLLSFLSLTSIHLIITIAVITTGLYIELPILLVICVLSLLIHLLMHFLPYLVHPKKIYLFKVVVESVESGENKIKKVINSTLK
ncbi:MAG: carotenoid biosynthesis protein [Candidatus Taylorbacteria bacterium]